MPLMLPSTVNENFIVELLNLDFYVAYYVRSIDHVVLLLGYHVVPTVRLNVYLA